MSSNFMEYIANMDWKFASRNVDDDFHTDIVFLRVSVRKMHEFANVSLGRALLYYEGFTGEFYYSDERTKSVCQELINRLTSEPEWGDSINNQIHLRSKLLEDVWPLSPYYIDFSSMSNDELKQLYLAQLESQTLLYQAAWIPEVLQAETHGLTSFLVDQLGNMVNNEIERGQFFQFLTTSNLASIYAEQERELVELALHIKASEELSKVFELPIKHIRLHLPGSINRKLSDLRKKYSYLGYHGYGERREFDLDHYLFRLIELVKGGLNLDSMKMNLETKNEFAARKKKIVDELRINEKLAKVFQIYSDFAVSKARRRLAQLKNFYFLDKLIFELALRLDVPESIIRFMMPEEIVVALDTQKLDLNNIEKRTKEMIYFVDEVMEEIVLNQDITGFINDLRGKSTVPFTKKLYGTIACGGHAIGRAITITRNAEYDQVIIDEGLILVSIEADPDLLPIMKISKAIVTDQGGITCHAAVIAKEFGIPCVIGTRFATQFIKDGDLLEVDANKGVVTILEKGR